MSKNRKSTKGKKKDQDDERESLAFKVLSSQHSQELLEMEVDAMQDKLAEILNFPNHAIDLKEAAQLDYFTAGVWWGKTQGFSPQQLSAFFTVIHVLMENVRDKHAALTDSLKEFKKFLAGIGQDSGETSGGLECFDVDQAKAITDYVHMSFFQHYKLYEFMFTHTQAEEIIGTDLDIEVAKPADMPWPPPLEEGVTEEIYQAYIATPPPTPEPEPEEEKVEHVETEEEKAARLERQQRESELLASIEPDELKYILDSVAKDLLGGLQNEMAAKLRERENSILNRINKIHKVADS